jgi:hypothetical protein
LEFSPTTRRAHYRVPHGYRRKLYRFISGGIFAVLEMQQRHVINYLRITSFPQPFLKKVSSPEVS